MKNEFRIFAALCLINVRIALSQETFPNNCAAFGVRSQPNFDKKLYMGHWYIQGLYDYPAAENADCNTSTYILQRDTHAYANIIERIKNLQTNISKGINSLMIFDKPRTGQYIYKVPGESSSLPIQIMSTDYFNYSIEWNCTDQNWQSQCYVWVMTRDRVFNSKLKLKINQILNEHNIDTTGIRKMIQDKRVCS